MKKSIFLIAVFVLSLTGVIAQNNTNKSITTESIIAESLELIKADSLLAYMQALQDFETRFMLAPNRREVASWIMNKFLSFGISDVRLDSFLCYTYVQYDTITWQYNVEAKITGAIYPDHEIMLMGHYDSYTYSTSGNPFLVSPGADDNASGVAAVLECARVIMEMEYQPRNTLYFLATAAEELMYGGDSGAKHYAQLAYENNRKLGMIVNNDMIAWNDGSWTVTLQYPESSPHIAWLTQQVLETYTVLNPGSSVIWTFADLEPFVEFGYHGIYFMENFTPMPYPYYHTIFDVIDHLDTAYHAQITKLNLGLILHYEQFFTDAALLRIYDIPVANCTGTISPSIEIANHGSDTIFSTIIVYRVNQGDPMQFSWTGVLPFLETMHVELPAIDFDILSANNLEISIESVNGEADQFIGNNLKTIGIAKAIATPNEVKLMIRLDSNRHEITWEVRDDSGEIVYSGGPYSTPGLIINETMLFENGCHVFTIYDSGGDGLKIPGVFQLYYGTNTQILMGTSFGSKSQTQFDVGNTLWVPDQKMPISLNVFPNPLQDNSFIEFDLQMGMFIEANIHHVLGKKVMGIINQDFEAGFHSIGFNTKVLKPGMYLISVRFGDRLITRKLFKQ